MSSLLASTDSISEPKKQTSSEQLHGAPTNSGSQQQFAAGMATDYQGGIWHGPALKHCDKNM